MPWGIRTLDLLLRRQLLYPTELKAQMERVMGIEPTRPAWKAGILPLNYTRRSPCIKPLDYYTTIVGGCQVVLEILFDFVRVEERKGRKGEGIVHLAASPAWRSGKVG